jgi:beta-xylosidase
MTGSGDELDKLTDGQLDVLAPDSGGAEPASSGGPADQETERLDVWRDPGRPAEERVADLLRRMTLAEKVGQLRSTWPGSTPDRSRARADSPSGGVAPLQNEMGAPFAEWPELIRDGLGQLTRPFGTRPVTAREGAEALADAQRQIVAASRFGIPAVAHDECLTGFTAWTAAIYPTPLAWGASFDPPLVQEMAGQIGATMRAVGVHQGLAPVLDVTVDPRWGRTEETIGEDPYLVATVGTAYVRGLESAGLICTLKHFAGYSASRGGRNLAPSSVTSRQLADLLLPPFEMAIRLGRARSVMHAYTEIDGVPTASDPYLLSEVLRDEWDFTGTVVADYFGISFLELLHRVASGPADAAGLALAAGVDVELPTVRCYGPPLIDAVGRGQVDEALVDRAARRVLLQKCELGLLDPGWQPSPEEADVDLAPPAAVQTAARLAEESIVLLANDGVLPLAAGGRIAVVGPRADDALAMLGCYTFPAHVGVRYPDLGLGVEIPTFLAALRDELPGSQVTFLPGCAVEDPDVSGIAAAASLAAESDVCIAVVGDQAGLFGRGTSGEGCDAPDLNLPGVQGQLLEAVLATGTPVVLVLLTGRPYALGRYPAAATVQAFFPGQEGGPALARVLSGAVSPSGRLPVSVPRHAGAQPTTYLGPVLAHKSTVSAIDPDALYPFGHGLTYTAFRWTDVAGPTSAQVPTDGAISLGLTVSNVGERAGAEVVQVYLHDPVAQVTRPTAALVAYTRLELEPGQSRRVEFTIHTDLLSFTGRSGARIVEPGRVELRLGTSSTDFAAVVPVDLTGPERTIRGPRTMTAEVRIEGH